MHYPISLDPLGCGLFYCLLTNTCIRVIILAERGNAMTIKDKELLRRLLQDGWVIDRIQGSHHILKKGDKTETVPVHGRDVPTGLLNKILKHTGLKLK